MTAPSLPDPYAVLGVTAAASSEELHQAFRGLIRRHHPDTREPTASGTDDDRRLQQILTAYATLSDPTRRAAYDRTRVTPATTGSAAPELHVSFWSALRIGEPVRGEPAIRVGPVHWEPPQTSAD